jgi:hypothetical protein
VVMTTVSLPSSETQLVKALCHAATVLIQNMLLVQSFLLTMVTSGPPVAMIRPSCNGRDAPERVDIDL